MERLLADAEKLTGQKYDLSNLGDVYNAIGAIQQNLGIAGVAAQEAQTTFSGSFGAMQAAATNFLASLTLGENVGPALTTLLGTVSTFLVGNLLPMVGNIFKSLPEVASAAITEGIPAIQTALSGMLSGFSFGSLPEILNAGAEMITQISNGIAQNFPAISQSAVETITNFVSGVLDNLPAVMEAGMNLLTSIVNGIIQNLPALIQAAINLVTSVSTTVGEHLPEILQAGIELIGQFIAGLIQKAPEVLTEIGQIILDTGNKFTTYDWADIGKKVIDGIAQGLKNSGRVLVDAAKEAAKKAFEAAKDFLGIKSPSRLFRDEVGAMMAEGMAIGFEDNVPTAEIQSALQPMASVVPDAMGGNAYNYGGFSISIYQAPGQSAEELADIIETRINQRVMSKQAVFA